MELVEFWSGLYLNIIITTVSNRVVESEDTQCQSRDFSGKHKKLKIVEGQQSNL